MTVLVSSSALATLTVASPLLKKDTLLHVIVSLASPLQLKIVETKKGHDLLLSLHSGETLLERNAILRSLCGPALQYALDKSPLLLQGGHSITSKASPVSAMALAGISSWQSVADSIKRHNKPESVSTFMGQLNDYLATRAFLIPSTQCTLADMDLALAIHHAMTPKNNDLSIYPNLNRWMHQVHAVLVDYATPHGIIVPEFPVQETVISAPIFFYGTEEEYVSPAKQQQQQQSDNTSTVSEERKQAAVEKRAKKAAQKKETKPQLAPSAAATSVDLDISALDIRVGKITKVWHHKEAEKLFCEEIDVGEDEDNKPRQIASGLRPFYSTQDLEHCMVLVLCNLKARNLVGFPSHGMVLCASNSDHTEVKFVEPPAGSIIGERVVFQGIDMKEPEAENKVAKKKVFEKLAPDLKTNENGVVVWKGHVATTSAGTVTAKLPNAQVA
jgi:methionine--tRNA ligase beta chain